ncbi:MAG: 1-deoxy-D-xylulose-5-phosphate reductoisomerase [Syntrophobacterales bacterium]|jgi:1-deoxy-D-xylulose-5-phosphate reductoisomerase|nr:1-deoxy-D-xylulose-5-phosphate reductoisomerase [Syntrophobacterales bacterium]
MKRLAILGSTGSIGRSTLAVVAEHPGEFAVTGLAAGQNVEVLAQQIQEFQPLRVSVRDQETAGRLKLLLPANRHPAILWGPEGAKEVALADGVDLVVSAMVGAVGLEPTLAAIEAGIPVALANKETLVAAGSLVMAAAKAKGVPILPVDSEHSAIFQALQGQRPEDVGRLWLTASGGPFRTWEAERLGQVTAAQALKHPNWSMGPKITIDSATMMNKALEVIEASVLFGLPVDQVGVYIHPQSIIHSLVEFVDGSVLAQLGVPDMRLPIAYALTYPRRLPLSSPPLDLCRVGQLTFEAPDLTRFPGLGLGYAAARNGGTMPAVLNAANEMAVAAFLEGRLSFMGIPQTVEATMAAHQQQPLESLEQVLAVNRWARDFAHGLINQGRYHS